MEEQQLDKIQKEYFEQINDRMDFLEDKVNKTYEKTSYCLEAVVKLLQEINSQENTNQSLIRDLNRIQQEQTRILNRVNDSVIMTNNINTSVDDLKNDLTSISDKVDGVDYSIKNLKIYKYYSSDDI